MGILKSALKLGSKNEITTKKKISVSQLIKFSRTQTPEERKESLLKYLENLQKLESKLWGITIKTISNGEDRVLEDTNHLIYLISRNKADNLNKILKTKNLKEFAKDIKNLREDFLVLKRQIKQKNHLRNLISNYTIRLVSEENYAKLETIFLLEKQLHEVIEKQEEEINRILIEVHNIKLPIDKRIDSFITSLIKMRGVLSGHMDHHALWEEERYGYSNTSNILHSLIKEVKEDI